MWGKVSSAGRSSEPLAVRRRTRRRRSFIALFILLLLLLTATLYGLQQEAVRISSVEVFGADPSLATYATDAMQGWYGGIIPRDSILFFPEDEIRARILADYGYIAALSITRRGFTGLSLTVDSRTPIARWCGLSPTAGVDEYCYIFDANGFIYAAAALTIKTINTFALYAPLEGETLEPLHANIASAEKLPAAFDFARELTTFGSPVAYLIIREGEADNHLVSGTRVTYVLGAEENAFTALFSAREQFNLADGSIDYIDLRFDGKVYVKRVQEQ